MLIQWTTTISSDSWFIYTVQPYMACASEASVKPSQARSSQVAETYLNITLKTANGCFTFLQSFFLFKFSQRIYERFLLFFPSLTEFCNTDKTVPHKNIINIQP